MSTFCKNNIERPNKRKMANVLQSSNTFSDSRTKRQKLKNNDENMSTTKDESFSTSTSFKVKVEPQKSSKAESQTVNNPLSAELKSTQAPFQYRLIIHIDKILSKPGPKSEKLLRSARLENKLKKFENIKRSVRVEDKVKNARIIPRSLKRENENNSKEILRPLNKPLQKSTNKSDQQNLRVSDKNKSVQEKLKVLDPNESAEKNLRVLNRNKSDQQMLRISDQNEFTQKNLRVSDRNKSVQQKLKVSDKNQSSEKDFTIKTEPTQRKLSSPNKSVEQKVRFSNKNDVSNKDEVSNKEKVQQNLSVSDQSNSVESSPQRMINLKESSSNSSPRSILKKSDSNSETSVQRSFQKLINSSGEIPRCQSGCQLEKIIWNSDPAFKCKKCNNVYIPQPIKELDKARFQCVTCKKTFETSEILYSHVEEHLTCDICYCLFKTQFEYKSHMGLHVSGNRDAPLQCHLCDLEFITKTSIQEHVSVVHMLKPKTTTSQDSPPISQDDHLCKICDLTFKNEESLSKHMDSHKDADNSANAVGQLKSVKFSCAVCGMEFTTLAEIDDHTKTHIKTNIEERKCNICKIFFANDRILSDHLKEHVARAIRCHLCPKAFINKASLRNHLKTHT